MASFLTNMSLLLKSKMQNKLENGGVSFTPLFRNSSITIPPLPVRPLQNFFSNFMRQLCEKFPHMFERLGEYEDHGFLIDPLNVPFMLLLKPNVCTLELVPRNSNFNYNNIVYDVRIAGDFFKLVDLIDSGDDSDALFFSRDVIVEGDMSAALALRNSLDDADINLINEFANMYSILTPFVKYSQNKAHKISGFLRDISNNIDTIAKKQTIYNQ